MIGICCFIFLRFGYIQNAFEKIFQTIKGRLKVPSSGAMFCPEHGCIVPSQVQAVWITSIRRNHHKMLVPIFNYLLFHRIIGVSLLALHKGIQSPQFQGLIGIIAPHGSQSTATLQQHPIVCRKFPASADLALILLGHGLLHRRYINLS